MAYGPTVHSRGREHFAPSGLLLIAVFKSLALLLSLGSGTSGGLLAPKFMASAALGGLFAVAVNRLVPGAQLGPGAFALVAMGAVFGAASAAPFTFMASWSSHLQEDSLRETGWLHQLRRNGADLDRGRQTLIGHVVDITPKLLKDSRS